MTTARTLSRAVAGLLALSVGGGSLHTAAAQGQPDTPERRPFVQLIIPKIDADTVAIIDEAHEEQARFFGEFFEKLDRVFGEQYLEDREHKIQVRAGLETTFNDHGDSTDTRVRIGLRVPLPAMRRRFNAFVDIGEDYDQLGAVSSPNFSESEKAFSLAAGLLRRYRDNLEAGLKLRLFSNSRSVFSLYPFLRFEERSDRMRYFFEQRVIWESDGSWSTRTDFDVDRSFGNGLFLRLRNRVDYSFEESVAKIAHGLIARHGVFDASGLSLELWLEYDTAGDDPETLDDDSVVFVQLRLRGRVWRNWLEFELRPIYTVPLEGGRNSFFGFFVGLTVLWDSNLGGDTTPDEDTDR